MGRRRRTLITNSGGSLANYVYVPPAAFDWVYPFDIGFNSGYFSTTIEANDYKITPTTVYYVATDGSSDNNGLSISTPKSGINQAIALGNASGAPFEIRIADGLYTHTYAMTTIPTQSFNVVSPNSAIISHEWETKTGFALTTNNTYVRARSDVLSVFDSSIVDSDAIYEKLTLVANQAACEATAGTWFTDNTDVWVHASDNRDLATDASAIKLMIQSGYPRVQGDVQCYFENIHFEGGETQAFDIRNTGLGQSTQGYFKNCSFNYCAVNNGLNAYGVPLLILDNCTTAKNYKDGFNYHALNSTVCNVVEIDSLSTSNGWSGSVSNNASTVHDGCKIIRLKGGNNRGIYKLSEGRNIHDIDNGTLSLNLGINVKDSRETSDASGSVNYTCGDGTADEVTKMWLVRCLSSGSITDLRVEDDSFIYVDNNLINGTNIIDATGAITAFTPVYFTPSTFTSYATKGVLSGDITYTGPNNLSYYNEAGVMQFSALNTPVIDYVRDGSGDHGVSSWEAKTNLRLHSQELDNSEWTKTNCSISANTHAAPDGTTTMDTVTRGSTSAALILQGTTKAASAIKYTTSVFIHKTAGTAAYVALRAQGSYPARVDVVYRKSTNALTFSSANTFTDFTSGVENISDDIARVWMTYTTDNHTSLHVYGSPNAGGGRVDTVDSSSNASAVLWGWQTELGDLSPYIPTTTSAVTRAAVNMSGAVVGGSRGSIFVDFKRHANVAAQTTALQLDDGTSNNRFLIYQRTPADSKAIASSVASGGVSQSYLDDSSGNANIRAKTCLTFEQDSFRFNSNENTIDVDSSGDVPTTSTLNIGVLNGVIRELKISSSVVADTELLYRTARGFY